LLHQRLHRLGDRHNAIEPINETLEPMPEREVNIVREQYAEPAPSVSLPQDVSQGLLTASSSKPLRIRCKGRLRCRLPHRETSLAGRRALPNRDEHAKARTFSDFTTD